MSSPLLVSPIAPAQTLALRQAILRPGAPPEASVYAADDAPSTFHLGLFDGASEAPLGIASFFRDPLPAAWAELVRATAPALLDAPPWRLRGMAVDAPYQSRGYGSVLLQAGFEAIATRGGGLLWCNARVAALEFYRRLGFRTWGDEFTVPDIGQHFVMARRVDAASSTP